MLNLETETGRIQSKTTKTGLEAMAPEFSVVVRNLSKYYVTHAASASENENKGLRLAANQSVSLEIKRGEIFGLLGPNGAGKTTLVNQILGLVRSDEGSIEVEGVDVIRFPRRVRQVASYLPQADMNFGTLEVQRLLWHAGELRGLKKTQARIQAETLIAELDLDEIRHRYFSRLSGGQKRLTGLAMALMGEPRLLVLDEPTNELDPARRRKVWEFIRAHKARTGTTYLIVTHNIVEAEAVLERVGVMVGGRLDLCGTPVQLKQEFSNTFRLDLFFKPAILEVLPAYPILPVVAKIQETPSPPDAEIDSVAAQVAALVLSALAACQLLELEEVTIKPYEGETLGVSLYLPMAHAATGVSTLLNKIGLEYVADFKLGRPSLEEVYLDLVTAVTASGTQIQGINRKEN